MPIVPDLPVENMTKIHMFWINFNWLFTLNTKYIDHNFLLEIVLPVNKETKKITPKNSRALHALAIQTITAYCILCC